MQLRCDTGKFKDFIPKLTISNNVWFWFQDILALIKFYVYIVNSFECLYCMILCGVVLTLC